MQAKQSLDGAIDLVPELQSLFNQFERICRDAEDLLRGLSHEQFNWRQEAGRWSIGECLDHLNITADFYQPMIDLRMSEGRAQGKLSEGPFRHGWLGNRFVSALDLPVKTKFKAPKMFVPPLDRSMDEVAAKFFAAQEEFFNLIRQASGLDLARIRIQIPATKLLRVSLGQAFALMSAHERRHLWQARQVEDQPNFPRV